MEWKVDQDKDSSWSTHLEDYEVQVQYDSCQKISFDWSLQLVHEDEAKRGSPIMVYGGNFEEVFIMHGLACTIKKGGPTWESQDRHHLAQVDYAQGKGMILIGFLFYRSHDVSERPDYMIVNCTIKRGSQVSNLIASLWRAQTFAYLAYHIFRLLLAFIHVRI